MTADPAGTLRLLEAPARPEPPAARPLRLISALATHGRVARAEGGLAGAGSGFQLRLPGIGGRYLAGLARGSRARLAAAQGRCPARRRRGPRVDVDREPVRRVAR